MFDSRVDRQPKGSNPHVVTAGNQPELSPRLAGIDQQLHERGFNHARLFITNPSLGEASFADVLNILDTGRQRDTDVARIRRSAFERCAVHLFGEGTEETYPISVEERYVITELLRDREVNPYSEQSRSSKFPSLGDGESSYLLNFSLLHPLPKWLPDKDVCKGVAHILKGLAREGHDPEREAFFRRTFERALSCYNLHDARLFLDADQRRYELPISKEKTYAQFDLTKASLSGISDWISDTDKDLTRRVRPITEAAFHSFTHRNGGGIMDCITVLQELISPKRELAAFAKAREEWLTGLKEKYPITYLPSGIHWSLAKNWPLTPLASSCIGAKRATDVPTTR